MTNRARCSSGFGWANRFPLQYCLYGNEENELTLSSFRRGIIRGREQEQKGQPNVTRLPLFQGCYFRALVAPKNQIMITRAPLRARGALGGRFTSIFGVAGITIRGS